MTRDMTELALPTRTTDALPALVVEPDRPLQEAWRVACEWCGPSRSEICVREFLRGLIFSPGTWSVLEHEYRVDMREASAAVARDSDSGLRLDGQPLAISAKLKSLLNKAGARVLETGKSELTTRDVVEALWDMPGEERHCMIFPGFVVRSAERAADADKKLREKQTYEAVVASLPKQVEAMAADLRNLREQATPPAQIAAIKLVVDQLAAALSDAPGPDTPADRLSKSFDAVHMRLKELSAQGVAVSGALQQQRTALEVQGAQAREQRAIIDAQSAKLAKIDAKTLNWRWRPSWWPRRPSAT